MGIVLKGLKWLALLIVAFVLIGFVLPGSKHVERSREIAAPPQKIWPLLAEPKQWTAWQPWYAKDPAMKLTYSGAPSGTGAQWAWDSATQGKGSMSFVRADAPKQLEYLLKFEDMGSTATGTFTLEPAGAGTKVTWAFDTSFGRNPLMRWFGLGLDSMVGQDFETGLERLSAAATKSS
jgi:uncharacterized protein YndB with AHSA1/START domain